MRTRTYGKTSSYMLWQRMNLILGRRVLIESGAPAIGLSKGWYRLRLWKGREVFPRIEQAVRVEARVDEKKYCAGWLVAQNCCILVVWRNHVCVCFDYMVVNKQQYYKNEGSRCPKI
jgi:hypothetical protein